MKCLIPFASSVDLSCTHQFNGSLDTTLSLVFSAQLINKFGVNTGLTFSSMSDESAVDT